MQGNKPTKGETNKTFRRQVRFPKELINAIDKKAGKRGFSAWVIAACEDKLRKL